MVIDLARPKAIVMDFCWMNLLPAADLAILKDLLKVTHWGWPTGWPTGLHLEMLKPMRWDWPKRMPKEKPNLMEKR